MVVFIITLMVLSLTSNMIPLFNVVAILGLFLLYFFRGEYDIQYSCLRPKLAIRFLMAAYAFWTFSYILTGAPITNFFSYDFLRLDGAILVGYLPLLLIGECGLSTRIVSRLILGYLGVLSIVAALGALQFVSNIDGLDYDVAPNGIHWNVLYRSYLTTDVFHGWYRAHNAAGSIYAMAACTALAFALGQRKVKLISWPCLVLAATFTGLATSQSRSGYVSFAAAFFIVFLRSKRYARPLLRICVFVILPLVLFWLSQSLIARRVQWMTNFGDPNVLERFDYYQRAVRDFANSPLIGIGFGRYNDEFKGYSGTPHFIYIATSGQVVNLDDHAHDSYLHFLAEGGVVGLFLMLGIWIATYRWAGHLRSLFGDTSRVGVLAQAIQSSIVVVLFFSLTEHEMGMALSPLTVFTMVGLLRNMASYELRRAIPKYRKRADRISRAREGKTLTLRPREAQ